MPVLRFKNENKFDSFAVTELHFIDLALRYNISYAKKITKMRAWYKTRQEISSKAPKFSPILVVLDLDGTDITDISWYGWTLSNFNKECNCSILLSNYQSLNFMMLRLYATQKGIELNYQWNKICSHLSEDQYIGMVF